MDDKGRAVDLASGRSVVIRVEASGGVSEQARWAARCDRFFALRHGAFARLIDYGSIGEGRRFEAWQSEGRWTGRPDARAVVLERARRFLAASALSVDGLVACAVVRSRDRAVVLPPAGCGADIGDGAEGLAIDDVAACGWADQPSLEVAAIGEVIAELCARTRIVSLWSSDGMRVQAAVESHARVARLSGLVPISLAIRDEQLLDLARQRSQFMIGNLGAGGWAHVLDRVLRTPSGHVVLLAGRTEIPRVRGVALRPLSAEALVGLVRPRHVSRGVASRLIASAERARGSIETFARMLWGHSMAMEEESSEPAASRVAEAAAEYVCGPARAAAVDAVPAAWPAPGEIAALRRKAEGAVTLLDAGRWAAGERVLRQTIGGLARRRDWPRAAAGAVALAEALLGRGRAQDALRFLDEARDYAGRADGAESELIGQIALVSASAWIELADLDKGESILRAWLLGAAPSERTARGFIALGRCLLWRGRFHEVADAVRRAETASRSEAAAVLARALLARASAGKGDTAGAISTATACMEAARVTVQPHLVCAAAYALATAHLVAGDVEAVGRDVAVCVHAARAAHAPLVALKARLVGAEAARRAGRERALVVLLDRVKRLSATALPPILRAQADLLHELLAGSDERAVKRRIAASGLGGLAILAAWPPAPSPAAPGGAPAAGVADTLELLECCQRAADDHAVLRDVCVALKARLGAAAVSFYACLHGAGGRRLAPLAAEGRIDPEFALRVVELGDGIRPHQNGERIEGGTPIRYGGEVIGALVCRWTLTATYDAERSAAFLAIAAAASAPAVATALAHLTAPAGTDELVGTSAAMDEVRRAVERAAAAPFAVLIQGESGCGKELAARALHRRGARRNRPFCTVNCAALPEELIESELFGHVRGAFTGAAAERAGVFEEAHGGTLFLDEVGELSPRAQAKVLRAIQEGEIRRVGENLPRRVDVRVVSATNRNLKDEVAAGRFRLDLLYRLDVVHIELPPLRARREDIAQLAEQYWRIACERVGGRATLAAATLAALARYDWPGNVRELQNVLSSLAVRAGRRGVVLPTALPATFSAGGPDASWRLDSARRTFEEQFVRAALARSGGHRARAAAELGLSRQGLTKLLARLGITDG